MKTSGEIGIEEPGYYKSNYCNCKVLHYNWANPNREKIKYLGRAYEILELIGAYPDGSNTAPLTFLARTPYGVYALYFDGGDSDTIRNAGLPAIQTGQWVLHYYVEADPAPSEVDMLVDLKLKQIADFHGHLCPDLIIGYRTAQYALSRLEIKLAMPNLRVIVENNTSAVDAIQMLTGCTPGNLRLVIRDEGKHVYTFQINSRQGLRLTLAPAGQELPAAFLNIERKIQSGIGGEPFAQAPAAARLGAMIKASDLDLWVYTGFEWEDLLTCQNEPGFAELLGLADVVMDGPFIQALRWHALPFRGSANQRAILAAESLRSGKVVEWMLRH